MGYTLFFLSLLKNIDCGYSLEPPWRGGSNKHLQCISRNMKNIRTFLSENFPFLVVKFSIYLNRRVFIMCPCTSLTNLRTVRLTLFHTIYQCPFLRTLGINQLTLQLKITFRYLINTKCPTIVRFLFFFFFPFSLQIYREIRAGKWMGKNIFFFWLEMCTRVIVHTLRQLHNSNRKPRYHIIW